VRLQTYDDDENDDDGATNDDVDNDGNGATGNNLDNDGDGAPGDNDNVDGDGFVGGSVGWSVGRSVGGLVGRPVSRSVGWSVGRGVGRSVVWSVGQTSPWLVAQLWLLLLPLLAHWLFVFQFEVKCLFDVRSFPTSLPSSKRKKTGLTWNLACLFEVILFCSQVSFGVARITFYVYVD